MTLDFQISNSNHLLYHATGESEFPGISDQNVSDNRHIKMSATIVTSKCQRQSSHQNVSDNRHIKMSATIVTSKCRRQSSHQNVSDNRHIKMSATIVTSQGSVIKMSATIVTSLHTCGGWLESDDQRED
jgi:hypothetical protein